MTRSGNLLTLKIIKCLACYDFGEIIDPFDQAKRTRGPLAGPVRACLRGSKIKLGAI